MANRFCKKCGKEVAEGKRFCGGCGQAMPTATVPAQPESVAAPVPVPQLCSKCGATLAPGKRFCKQCGQAVDQPTPVVEPAPAAVAIPAPPVCVHCRATLAPGKRFCKQCGQAVDSIAPAAQVKADSSEQGDSPATQPAVLDLPPAVQVAAPEYMQVSVQDVSLPVLNGAATTEEPDAPLPAQDESASAWPSTPSPEESESPLPSSPSATIASQTPSQPDPEPRSPSKMKLGLAIGIVAVLLVAAGSVFAWRHYAHRGVSAGTTASEPQQAIATPQQQPKPSPGIQEQPVSNPPQSPLATEAKTPLSPPSTIPVSVSHQHAQAVTPLPTIVPAPPSPPVSSPVTPHSGVLHYQGPPIPYNGVVVFDNLPKARLKFTFDHQAWSLILKVNPDGTKKATLISLAPGYQTKCDLSWEIVQ